MSNGGASEALDMKTVFPQNSASVEDPDNTCPICLEHMENPVQLEGCTHRFHAKCAIAWFRTGNTGCPICRSQPTREYTFARTRKARVSNLRRFARRKAAPSDLKKLVKRLQNAEKKLAVKRKEFKAWKKSDDGVKFRELQKMYRKMRRRCSYWGYGSIHRLETQISEYPVVPLVLLPNARIVAAQSN